MTEQQRDELRIFISSTFIDMMDEREQLIKHVFPEIRAYARERGIEFTEIDLRWGITTEEARLGKTLRVCLMEIDKCRPYFIGMIGSRYGWQPTLADVAQDDELLTEFPWVSDAIANGMSVTEMEMRYAALDQPRSQVNAFFYIRDPEVKGAEPALEPLKNVIINSGYPVLHNYRSVDQFAERVRSDLLTIVDSIAGTTAHEREIDSIRRAHLTFARSRIRAYVPNHEYNTILTSYAESDGDVLPLIVTGSSGLGKSSLMSHWSQQYVREHPATFVIRHFIGAADNTASSVMRHIMLEIADRTGSTDPIPNLVEEIEQEFPSWLERFKGERMVIIIDAVNQLETDRERSMHWLPAVIPPNIRLIVSITPEILNEVYSDPTSSSIAKWRVLPLLPADDHTRREIIEKFLAGYRKALSREQLERIALAEQCQSPLFLRVLLEELRVFGRFEELDERIDHLLSSADPFELFDKVLARFESDFGRDIVTMVLSSIRRSRYGLSETELLGIVGTEHRIGLSQIINGLDFHLIRTNGLYGFFHTYLERSVEARYFSSDTDRRQVHHRLAAYFSQSADLRRRSDEEPYHYQNAHDPYGMSKVLVDQAVLPYLLADEHRQDLYGYWRYVQEHIPLDSIYEDFSLMIDNALDEGARLTLQSKLGAALTGAGEYKTAERILGDALKQCSRADIQLELCIEVFSDLAALLYEKGEFDKAEALLRDALSMADNPETDLYRKCLNSLGSVLYALGKLDEAEQSFHTLLAYTTDPHRGDYLNNLGAIYYGLRRFDESADAFHSAIAEWRKRYGRLYYKIQPALSNLAAILTELGRYDEAEKVYHESLDMATNLYSMYHIQVALVLSSLSILYSKMGKLPDAIEHQVQAIDIVKKILKPDHQYEIMFNLSLAILYLRTNTIEPALTILPYYMNKLETSDNVSPHYIKLYSTLWQELHPESYRIYKEHNQ